jgi:Dyp-type peroxidase family
MISSSSLPGGFLEEIQGNVYPGFKKPRQTLIFVQFSGDRPDPQGWLQRLRPEISSGLAVQQINDAFKARRERNRGHETDDEKDRTRVVNVAFTMAGLQKLDAPDLVRFPEDFSRVARLRARAASDDDSDIENWRVGGRPDRVADAVLILGTDLDTSTGEDPDMESLIDHHHRLLHEHGLDDFLILRGAVVGDGREHFGYRDSISQPIPVDGTPPEGSEEQVHFSEFVLDRSRKPRFFLQARNGHQRGDDYPAPDFPDWARGGSYLVFRQMEQLVPVFQAEAQRCALDLFGKGIAEMDPNDDGVARFSARCIGRWQNGTPVNDRSTPPPDDERPDNPGSPTAEAYREDKYGLRTPRYAHIRKVHPRDYVEKLGDRIIDDANNHRIIRRGITYSATNEAGEPEVGLLFLGYQASIEEQFEWIMRNWANSDQFSTLKSSHVINVGSPGQDALVGANQTSPKNPREPFYPIGPDSSEILREERLTLERFVVMRGGDYFFSPSLPGLDALSRR